MRLKSFVFLFVFVFTIPNFSAVNTNSGSSSMGKPSVKFKSWQVGRSLKGTVENKEQLSFITSTETVCWFTASVGYNGNQGDNVSPIDPSKVTWTVENPSHGMVLDTTEPLEKNWSGDSHPSKLAASTSFNVVGKLTVPPHIGTSQSHCPNYEGTSTPLNGRADTPMTFTIKFAATTEDGQSVDPVELVLIQDEKDEMRQEYMDLAGETDWKWKKIDGTYQKFKDGNVLRVPSRSAFDTQNTYDDGHYSYMMGKNVLPVKEDKWEKALKTFAETDRKRTNVPAFDLTETGGYRNPHHHYYHVPNGSSSPRSWHQFGLALDVRSGDKDGVPGIDMNGDNQRGTLADRADMANAAKKYAGASWTKHTYSDGHVHAQWEWEGSNKEGASTASSGRFSLPPKGTDQPVTVAPAPPAPVTGDCGIHTISTSQTANHASTNFACGSHTYYACQTPATSETNRHSHQTLPCGSHSGYRCTATSSHTQTTTCPTDTNGQACSYSSYYACSPHTHAYPELPADPPTPPPPPPPPTTVACGGAPWTDCPGASSQWAHRVSSCSQCGSLYWTCSQWAYQHTSGEKTCRRPGCGVTYYECQNGPCISDWGTYDWHWAE